MGELRGKVSDEVEMEFRQAVLRIYGNKKGAVGKALEEAIKLWLSKYSAESEFVGRGRREGRDNKKAGEDGS